MSCQLALKQQNRVFLLSKLNVNLINKSQTRQQNSLVYITLGGFRTRAFIFVWSSSSAVNGSQARTYDDDDDVAQHGAHTGQLILHTSMQFDIGDPFYGQLTAVKSRYSLTSTTWPYRGVRLELIEVKCFCEVDRWPSYGFSLDRKLKCLPKLLEQAKQPVLRF